MSRNMKYMAVIGGAVLVLCCIGAITTFIIGRSLMGQLSEAVVTDPDQAAQVGHEIVDYDVPEGYAERMAMNIGGIQTVMIAPTDTGTMFIMLMQFPASMNDPETMREQMQQSMEQQSQNSGLNMEVVGEEDVTIKGETVTLTISEGTDEAGNTLRQVTGIFPGKKGIVMLMITGGVSTWDDTALEDFITSIR